MGRLPKPSWSTGVLLTAPTVTLNILVVVVIGMYSGPCLTVAVVGTWLFLGVVLFDAGWLTPRRQWWATGLGYRKPNATESEILTAAWMNLTRAPGVDGWPYALWVQQSARLNAAAAPTRIVAVTSAALASLEPCQLEAVLAHELGHHLYIDQRLRLLEAWISIPTRVGRLLVGVIGRPLNVLGPSAIAVRFVLGTLLIVLVSAVLDSRSGLPLALLFGALAVIETFTVPARSRSQEFAADRMAVDLGYGNDLASALLVWQSHRRPLTGLHAVRARWFGTHPLTTARLRAIHQ